MVPISLPERWQSPAECASLENWNTSRCRGFKSLSLRGQKTETILASTMILNASYEPLTIVSAKRAVTLLLNGKAVSVEDGPHVFRSNDLEIQVPYVIKLTYFVQRKAFLKPAKYSKATVLVRDGHSCAYCGRHATTIDHIIPRKHGGLSTYENCVAACTRCNSKKADKLLKEVGYQLLLKPYAPSPYSTLLSRVKAQTEVFDAWSKYVFMYQPELAEVFAKRDAAAAARLAG